MKQDSSNTRCSSNPKSDLLQQWQLFILFLFKWFAHVYSQDNGKYMSMLWIGQQKGTIVTAALMDWLQRNTGVTDFSVQRKTMDHFKEVL